MNTKLSILLSAILLSLSSVASAQFYAYKDGKLIFSSADLTPDSITFESPIHDSVGGLLGKSVDLGLSVRWASWNVGASSATEAGAYFGWGETTVGKETNDWSSYKYGPKGNPTKYNSADGLTSLQPSDDAASSNWGPAWRTPTLDEWQELVDNCTWVWKAVGEYEDNAIPGFLVTSNVDGYTDASIFIPAAGGRWEANIDYLGEMADYWTSDFYSSDYDYALGFKMSQSQKDVAQFYRCGGHNVRAVIASKSK